MATIIGHQGSLFGAGEPKVRSVLPAPQALDATTQILFAPDWLAGGDDLFDRLVVELPWRSVDRTMYDRIVAVPRLICSVRRSDLDGHDPLAAIWDELAGLLETDFTHMGANLYRDGNDSVAWHADKVGALAASTTIALLSLGARRPFKMRPRSERSNGRTRTWHLGAGDLFVMSGACQRDWEHGVPKVRTAWPRLSLAFRTTKR